MSAAAPTTTTNTAPAVGTTTTGTHHHQDVSKYQDAKTVEELRSDIAKAKKNIESGNVHTTFCCFGNSDKSKLAKLEKALEIELAKPVPETKEQEQIIQQEHEHHHHAPAGGIIAPHNAVDAHLGEGAVGYTPAFGNVKTLPTA